MSEYKNNIAFSNNLNKLTPLFRLSLLIFLLSLVNTDKNYGQVLTAEQIYKKASNAVVIINTYDDNNENSTQGSGVVLNDKGYIVTNYHILSENSRIEILHGKKTIPYIDIIGIDVDKDILILKIIDKKFPSLKIGNAKNLHIGQKVYTIGSPMGLENSISEGIISGIRTLDESGRNLIQITASISSGSSGGAVLNNKGELIGISTLTIKNGQNLNFAIPIEDVLKVEENSLRNKNNNLYSDWLKIGFKEEKNGNLQGAVNYYTKYIEKYPADAEAYYDRGNVFIRLKDYTNAYKDYNKVTELDPYSADAYCGLGFAKYQLNNYSEAILNYNKALVLNPNNIDVFCARGLAKSDLKDYQGAISDYNKAIELNPNLGVAYMERAIAKHLLGDNYGACADLSKAGELGESDAYELIHEFSR